MNEDKALDALLTDHFRERLAPYRQSVVERVVAQLPSLAEPIRLPTAAELPPVLARPKAPWWRWAGVSLGSAAAACLLTLWVLGATRGGLDSPAGSGLSTVGQPRGQQANFTPVRRELLTTVHNGATVVTDQVTGVRRVGQQVYERVLMYDANRKVYVELFIPRQQTVVIQPQAQ